MKKNSIDRQIIKALTIGLSASMMLQPVTAMAADASGENLPKTPEVDDAKDMVIASTEEHSEPTMNQEVSDSVSR